MSTFALARFQAIQRIGCLACRKMGYYNAPDVHHLNENGHAGQTRRGDMYTIGLCPGHHRGVVPEGMKYARWSTLFGPSLKYEPRRFREVFGDDDTLLAEENRLIDEANKRVVGQS